MKKVAAPEDVAPVTIGGTRYEVRHWGKTTGFSQNGGHVTAVEAATGKPVQTIELYKIDYRSDMETDKQDLFITDMAASPDGKALIVNDERGRRWRVDLSTHKSTPDTPG